jgi:glycosyltransferase involved in cell wall biosynthesis
VHIIGCNRHPELQTGMLAAEDIRANVFLEPEQDELQIARTLARAGVYAATSQYEPFGLAPVEAAFSRCAIVASDIPSLRELWDGVAVFFHNNDAASLRDAVEGLLRDPARRRVQGSLACRHARQRFTADRMVAAYMDLYQSLIPARAISA